MRTRRGALRAVTRRLVISGVLLSGALLSCSSGQQRETTPAPQDAHSSHSQRSRPAPEFTLDELDGREFRLSEHLGESAVLLYFWATCCEPCRVEMPHLERLYRTYRTRGFRIVAISMDGPDTIARVRSFVSRHELSFTVLLDDETEVMQIYNPRRASPFSVLIDPGGAIVWSREGYSPGDEEALEAVVVEVLEGQEEHQSESRR